MRRLVLIIAFAIAAERIRRATIEVSVINVCDTSPLTIVPHLSSDFHVLAGGKYEGPLAVIAPAAEADLIGLFAHEPMMKEEAVENIIRPPYVKMLFKAPAFANEKLEHHAYFEARQVDSKSQGMVVTKLSQTFASSRDSSVYEAQTPSYPEAYYLALVGDYLVSVSVRESMSKEPTIMTIISYDMKMHIKAPSFENLKHTSAVVQHAPIAALLKSKYFHKNKSGSEQVDPKPSGEAPKKGDDGPNWVLFS
jgi:hypothetical protein